MLFLEFISLKKEKKQIYWVVPTGTAPDSLTIACPSGLKHQLIKSSVAPLACPFVKKKNEDKLNSLKNLGNNNKCPNCGLNVTAGINECPRCHQKLNNIDGGFYNGKNNY